jgi:hypothetical protein
MCKTVSAFQQNTAAAMNNATFGATIYMACPLLIYVSSFKKLKVCSYNES